MITQHFKSFLRLFIIPVSFTSIVFLSACGGGGGDTPATPAQQDDSSTDFSNISESQAQATAKNLIGTNANSSLRALGNVATNSPAIVSAAETMGLDLEMPDTSPDSDSDDSSPTATVEQQISDALQLFFDSGVRVGDTITYDPDEQAMCNDAIMGLITTAIEQFDDSENLSSADTSTAINECVAVYSHVTVVLTILGEEQGVLAIKYDDFVLLTIGYSTSETYAELDLAQLKPIMAAIAADRDPPEDLELPSVFSGVIRMTNTVLGTDHGKMNISIPQAINIVDDTDDSSAFATNISIGATPKLIEVIANANDNTASVELAVAAINALFPVDVSEDAEHQGKLSLDGLTLLAELSSAGNTLVFSNIGIGNAPLIFDLLDPTGVLPGGEITDVEFSLDTFGFTIDGSDDTINIPNMFSALLKIDDQFDLLEASMFKGSLGVTVGDQTVLAPKQNSAEEETIEVKSGFINITTTEDFADSFGPGASFPAGSCIGVDEDALMLDVAVCD